MTVLETFRDPKNVIVYMLQATDSAKVAIKIGASVLLSPERKLSCRVISLKVIRIMLGHWQI